jgi:hypothetical protein
VARNGFKLLFWFEVERISSAVTSTVEDLLVKGTYRVDNPFLAVSN